MKPKIMNLIAICNALAQILFVAFVLPETVAVHFGFAMNVDRIGSKWTCLVLITIPIIISLLFTICRKVTKNKTEINKNTNVENIVIPVTFGIFVVVSWLFIILSAVCEPVIGAKANIPIPSIIVVSLGVLMLVMSNFYGKIKKNKYFGIRISWTLNNEQVWNKTHRFAGYVGVVAALLMIVFGGLSWILANNVLAITGILIGVTLQVVPSFIYAYLLYKKLGSDK